MDLEGIKTHDIQVLPLGLHPSALSSAPTMQGVCESPTLIEDCVTATFPQLSWRRVLGDCQGIMSFQEGGSPESPEE